jgi:D-hydroxyproline dehydrogenase subunit gamma
MGICFECRAVVDGVLHARTRQFLCHAGMRVETQL